MNLRESMNNNPAVVTIGAVVLLVICLGLIVMQLSPNTGGGAGSRDYYFYDLNTEQLFTHEMSGAADNPPVKAPSDDANPQKPSGMWAHVYACGECPGNLAGKTGEQVEQAGAWINHLERYKLDAKQQLIDAEETGSAEAAFRARNEGQMVKAFGEDAGWFTYSSGQGMQAAELDTSRCSQDESVTECFP